MDAGAARGRGEDAPQQVGGDLLVERGEDDRRAVVGDRPAAVVVNKRDAAVGEAKRRDIGPVGGAACVTRSAVAQLLVVGQDRDTRAQVAGDRRRDERAGGCRRRGSGRGRRGDSGASRADRCSRRSAVHGPRRRGSPAPRRPACVRAGGSGAGDQPPVATASRRPRARSPSTPRRSPRRPRRPSSRRGRWRARVRCEGARAGPASRVGEELGREQRLHRQPRDVDRLGAVARGHRADLGHTRSQSSGRPLPFCVPYGRPQAEAITLTYDQAPQPAQAGGRRLQLVPAVPQPPAPAPRVPDLRHSMAGARSWRRTTAATITTTEVGRRRDRPSRNRTQRASPLASVADRRAEPRPRAALTVAVDANGADLGVAEVVAGAAIAAEHGVHVLLFGDVEAARRRCPTASTVVHAPISIAKAADAVAAVRVDTRRRRSSRPRERSADGRADALVAGGSTGTRARREPVQHQARPRHLPPGAGDRRSRCPGGR